MSDRERHLICASRIIEREQKPDGAWWMDARNDTEGRGVKKCADWVVAMMGWSSINRNRHSDMHDCLMCWGWDAWIEGGKQPLEWSWNAIELILLLCFVFVFFCCSVPFVSCWFFVLCGLSLYEQLQHIYGICVWFSVILFIKYRHIEFWSYLDDPSKSSQITIVHRYGLYTIWNEHSCYCN